MSTIGTVELIATIDTSQYKRGAAEIDQANKNIESSGEQSSKGLSTAFSSVAKVGLAAVAAAAIAVGAAIATNIGSAIKRVDTLNNSSRTFANLGFDAKTVDSSMKALTKSIQGLPTPLDAAVRGVQLIASSTNDLGKSQKIFSAINNAIIGFGGTSDDVTSSVLQLSQAFSGGRIDAQTWNSMLANNLGPTLNALARSMGVTTEQLKTGLSDGTISVSQFQDALIKLNEQGGGGIKSLQKISKDATSGIGTGWENLNTAIQRGLAAVIQAIGSQNIASSISGIGKAFETALKDIVPVIKFIGQNKDIFGPVAAGLTAFISVITAWYVAVKIATAAQAVFNAVMTANPIGLVIVALATVTAALVYFFTKTETGRKIFSAFSDFVGKVWDDIRGYIQAVADFFVGAWSVEIKAVIGLFNTLKQKVSDLADAFMNSGFYKSITNAITAIQDFGTKTKGVFDDIIYYANPFADNFSKRIQDGLNKAKDALISYDKDTIKKWGESFNKVYDSVIQFGINLYNQMKTSLSSGIKAISDWGVDIYNNAKTSLANAVTAIYDWGIGLYQNTAQALTNVAKAIADWGVSLYQNAKDALVNFYNATVDFFVSLPEAIKDTLNTTGSQMSDNTVTGITSAFSDQSKMNQIGTAILGGFALVLASIDVALLDIGGKIISKIIDGLVNNYSKLYDKGSDLVGNLAQGTIDNIGKLIDFVSSIPRKVTNALGNLGGVLYSAGRDLINGLLNGAGSILPTIGNFFLDKLPSFIRGPFKKALGISSPSKVFAGYGQNITDGLIIGITSGISGVQSAVDKITPSLNIAPNTSAMIGVGGQASSSGSLSGLDNTSSQNESNQSTQITLNLTGVMARSKTDLREIGKEIIGAVNDELKSNGARLIGGGAI